MARLAPDTKVVIIQCLARFMTVTETQEHLSTVLGIDCTASHLSYYQPTGSQSAKLDQRWKDLFRTERQRYIAELSDSPMSHQRYRLDSILRLARKAEAKGEYDVALKAYEQASKEVGGIFTNLRKIESRNPKRALAELLGLSPDELPEDLDRDTAEA